MWLVHRGAPCRDLGSIWASSLLCCESAVSPREGSSGWGGYNDIDDDSDLYLFEIIKNKTVSGIIVPERCAYVIVLLFYKLVRK